MGVCTFVIGCLINKITLSEHSCSCVCVASQIRCCVYSVNRGKLTSGDVLGRLNYSLQGFPVQFPSQAVMQPVRMLSTVQLSEDF